jgi:hypothetical protein
MNNFSKVLTALGAFIGVLAVWTLLVTIPVQLLWNWLCPELFGLPKIGFLQTVGLIVLINFLLNRGNSKSDKS